jgi:hypothetical protein
MRSACCLRGFGTVAPSPLRQHARAYAYRGLRALASLSLARSDRAFSPPAHEQPFEFTVKDTRAGDERTPGPERPVGNEFVATPQAGMYRYFLSIFIQRGALRSTLIAS